LKLRLYQVDAFTDKVFGGNPAAVVPLSSWLDDTLLQAIAEENNLSETAFFVPSEGGFELRWFTSVREVDLCGHATLATAHILFNALGYNERTITFETLSGSLTVEKTEAQLEMNFPACPLTSCETPAILERALGRRPVETLCADDYVAVFENESVVQDVVPDQALLNQLDLRAVVITSVGMNADFVSRFFAPKSGNPEDPVTGSAHCELAPYWAGKLDKNILTARQLSRRGGDIVCEVREQRVILRGQAVTFMEGEITIRKPDKPL
jgi:PhzF family phenazine biosynthesis protein